MTDTSFIRLDRQFFDLNEDQINAIEHVWLLDGLGLSGSFGWSEVLTSPRVLMISEAGSGKTRECREMARTLNAQSHGAWYFDLAALAGLSGQSMDTLLDPKDAKRFSAWQAGSIPTATLFLDSVDELQMSHRTLDAAVTNLRRAICDHFDRVRIVVTARPVPFDRQLLIEKLPVPARDEDTPRFPDLAMRYDQKEERKESTPNWRIVGLMPLREPEVHQFGQARGVMDTEALIEALRDRDAFEFARRPLDLVELCDDWKAHGEIRRLKLQVSSNIATKLTARTDRGERADLPATRARQGAARLALAAMLTGKLSIRYSEDSDPGTNGAALDPRKILTDWGSDEIRTLLERALFSFASYGRVRFHHRSVMEFLAAEHLQTLMGDGMSPRALRRILIARIPDGEVLRPSLRPVAAWLASEQPQLRNDIRQIEPETLMQEGDPESLTPFVRAQILRSFVERHGPGGWRGLHVPAIQLNRFAAPDLSSEVCALWAKGVENEEMREILLKLAEFAPLPDMADAAWEAVSNPLGTEQIAALCVLHRLEDPRLRKLSAQMARKGNGYKQRFTEFALVQLFPEFMTTAQTRAILRALPPPRQTIGMLDYNWPHVIAAGDMPTEALISLRDVLTDHLCDTPTQKRRYRLDSECAHLAPALAACCGVLIERQGVDGDLAKAVTVAYGFAWGGYGHRSSSDHVKTLKEKANALPEHQRQTLFWATHAFLQEHLPIDHGFSWRFDLEEHLILDLTQADLEWLIRDLGNKEHPEEIREVALSVIFSLIHGHVQSEAEQQQLCDAVVDAPELDKRLQQFLAPPTLSPEYLRRLRKREKQKRQQDRRRKKDWASWAMLERDLMRDPDRMLTPDKAWNTCFNLWEVLRRQKEDVDRNFSGWNRLLMDSCFGVSVTDQVRQAMCRLWRDYDPNQITRFGIACIQAEAEEPNWARNLSEDEARQAAQLAQHALWHLPDWLPDLARARPGIVVEVLTPSLQAELRESSWHSGFVQSLQTAGQDFAQLFVPTLLRWLESRARTSPYLDQPGQTVSKQGCAADAVIRYGTDADRTRLHEVVAARLAISTNTKSRKIWLPILMRLDPAAGTDALEALLAKSPPRRNGLGVTWIGHLFKGEDRVNGQKVSDPMFTPSTLLRLARLAYTHVRDEHDQHHEGMYSPNARDDAQRGRGELYGALMSRQGPEAWTAKLELAHDPLFDGLKDRSLAITRETEAQSVDVSHLKESEVLELEAHREGPIKTRDQMFALLRDRLDQLEDLLTQDATPRELWIAIDKEYKMRRELAGRLGGMANGLYQISQEAVTGEEKETDIRLHATASDQQAVIELKLGNKGYSGRDLVDTLRGQLVKRYLAPENRRAGCLLITIHDDKKFAHPDTGGLLDSNGLLTLLQDEACKIEARTDNQVRLTVRLLDLRNRLECA